MTASNPRNRRISREESLRRSFHTMFVAGHRRRWFVVSQSTDQRPMFWGPYRFRWSATAAMQQRRPAPAGERLSVVRGVHLDELAANGQTPQYRGIL